MDDTKKLNLLIIEDSEDDTLLLLRELKRSGFDVHSKRVETETAVSEALSEQPWDIVISDFNMPHLTGIRALEIIRSRQKDLPFILVSGSVGEQLAVQAMKAGAQDYLMKDNLARLSSAVERELREAAERRKRREAEAALEEKSKQLVMAQRMEAIGQLAGGIAHDLNNIIGACTLYSEIALDPNEGVERIRDSVREIAKAQDRATRLVKQLLAFSRKQVVDPQIITLNQVIIDVQKMLSRVLGEDIELTLELASSPCPIKADPGQIDQVIMNLVVNARDAMPKGGKLLIQTSTETVGPGHWLLQSDSDLAAGTFARLTVVDTGGGMDEKTKARIFEPFFTTKELGKGTGLGLATVFGIVKQAGGGIRVESAIGKGTRFDILWEATDETLPEERETEREIPVSRGRSSTLLLVEDEESIRKALERTLSRSGYTLHVARDGEEGLKIFEKHVEKIDLLITDVVMPKISGPDLATTMRSRNSALKVLFLSGYDHEILTSYGIDHRSTFLLGKPFTARQVEQRIDEILRGHHG